MIPDFRSIFLCNLYCIVVSPHNDCIASPVFLFTTTFLLQPVRRKSWSFSVAVAETDDPETDVAETDDPETDDPETDGPETDVAETDDPETDVAETDDPETDVAETDGAETDAPETEVPETEEDRDGGRRDGRCVCFSLFALLKDCGRL